MATVFRVSGPGPQARDSGVSGRGPKEPSLRELKQKLAHIDYFARSPSTYWWRTAWAIPTLAVGYLLLLTGPPVLWAVFTLLVLAFASVQGAAIGHDAGHGAVSSNRSTIHLIGGFFMTLILGISFQFWLEKHGNHHHHSNSSADPDLDSDFLAFSIEDARKKRGIARFITSWQHLLIWPAITLIGFTLKSQSLLYLIKSRGNYLDRSFLAGHFVLWILVPTMFLSPTAALVNYLILTWFVGTNLGLIFLPNHVGRHWIDESDDKSWFYRQVATARNLSGSWLSTRIFNGLNSHIEHHLFPHVPFSRLAAGREVVKDYCSSHGIPYHEVGIRQSFGEIYRFNRELAEIARGLTPDREADAQRPVQPAASE